MVEGEADLRDGVWQPLGPARSQYRARCMWSTFCFYWGPHCYSLSDNHSHCQRSRLSAIETARDPCRHISRIPCLPFFRMSRILISFLDALTGTSPRHSSGCWRQTLQPEGQVSDLGYSTSHWHETRRKDNIWTILECL
jgi:hypothetical protein